MLSQMFRATGTFFTLLNTIQTMAAYIDKKQIEVNQNVINQYFIMGIDLGQLNILRTGVDLVEISLQEKSELSPEERAIYRKVVDLKNILAGN